MQPVYNGVLDLLQAITLPAAGKSGKDAAPETSSFAKLMEQQRQSQQQDTAPADGQPAEKPEASEAPAQPAEQDEEEVVRQMSWAALTVAPPPVAQEQIAVEAAPETATELPVAAVELAPADAELTQDLTDQTETALPMTVEQELAPKAEQPVETEAAPQEIQEPQTAQHAEAEAPRTVQRHEAAAADTAPAEAETEELQVEDAVEAPQRLFEDTDAIPVKVSEAPAAEQTEAPEPVDRQMEKPLLEALQQGESHVAIRLTPSSLGTVTVEVTRSTDGVLHVTLSAERMQTQGLLEKHMGSLQSMLAASGQDQVRIEVQRQDESAAYQPYDGRNGNNQNPQQQAQQDQREHRQRQQTHGQDFLQQLRLGLIPVE